MTHGKGPPRQGPSDQREFADRQEGGASDREQDATYGSLGAVIGFMTWIWISVTVVLLRHRAER